jgi:hypothetical protein
MSKVLPREWKWPLAAVIVMSAPAGNEQLPEYVGVGLPRQLPGLRHRRQERQSGQSDCEHRPALKSVKLRKSVNSER